MLNLSKTESGIFFPKLNGVQCSYCSAIIQKDNEAGKRLFLMDGRPACARCRILATSKMSLRIKNDRALYEKDLKYKETIKQERSNSEVAKVAAHSQDSTGTHKN